jgi:superfamily II DNA or RNA helicase
MNALRGIGKWGLNPLYQDRYHNWVELEQAITRIEDTTEKGNAFEQFSYFYFLYHRDLYNIEEVWCDKVKSREIPAEVRTRYRLEKKDFGVDGASRLFGNRLEAWQAKFHSDRSSAPYAELSTFWAEAEYANSRRIIANCTKLPEQAAKKMGHEQTLIDRFLELEDDFFEALYTFANTENVEVVRKVYTPRLHQEKIIREVVSGLETHDRGKLLAACGIGKTLSALWIAEHDKLCANRILVLAPSIALVGQTLREWIMHRNPTKPFSYLCVCSDKSIEDSLYEETTTDIDVSELDFSVTTTVEDVKKWLVATSSGRQYIFATYHSVDVIERAIKNIDGYRFDITFFDEAHRTVGRPDQQFAIALNDERLPSRKRLFMTATERLINPRVKTLAQQSGQEVFSMEDEEKYGPTLCTYNFGQAIQDGVIADYEILLVEVSDRMEQDLVEVNRWLRIEAQEEGQDSCILAADELLKAGFLLKAIKEEEVYKVVSFHAERASAIKFSKCLKVLAERSSILGDKSYFIGYVLGNQNAAQRAEIISCFEESESGVLGNVRVLSEGVDIPLIDSVYFVDPKTSLIDLVQAIGRALRKPYGTNTKVAKIIVPIQVPSTAQDLNDVSWDGVFQTFHNVIQAMRDQDQRLSEEINEINLYAVSKGGRGTRVGSGKKIRISMPTLKLAQTVDLEEFLNKITLRVARANANPEGKNTGFSYLGKGERKSRYKTVLETLGEYNPSYYQNSLVDPTLERFPDLSYEGTRKNLEVTSSIGRVSHNNVAYTEKLGLIRKVDGKKYCLTALGRMLKEGLLPFIEVFKNQMLIYHTSDNLFPYRVILEMLLRVETLNYTEFLYGPYAIQKSENGGFDVEGAIERILYIQHEFPRLIWTNLDNRNEVRRLLNERSPVKFTEEDVWGDRLAIANKFRYIKNSLALFDFLDCAVGYLTPLSIKPARQDDLVQVLEISDPKHAPITDFYGEWYWNA